MTHQSVVLSRNSTCPPHSSRALSSRTLVSWPHRRAQCVDHRHASPHRLNCPALLRWLSAAGFQHCPHCRLCSRVLDAFWVWSAGGVPMTSIPASSEGFYIPKPSRQATGYQVCQHVFVPRKRERELGSVCCDYLPCMHTDLVLVKNGSLFCRHRRTTKRLCRHHIESEIMHCNKTNFKNSARIAAPPSDWQAAL